MKVSLRLDVDVFDARNIIKWLRNKDVTQYLNEDENNALALEHLINTGQAGLLTYHLNQNSRFFLLDNEDEKCLGFITLFTIKEKQEYELEVDEEVTSINITATPSDDKANVIGTGNIKLTDGINNIKNLFSQ